MSAVALPSQRSGWGTVMHFKTSFGSFEVFTCQSNSTPHTLLLSGVQSVLVLDSIQCDLNWSDMFTWNWILLLHRLTHCFVLQLTSTFPEAAFRVCCFLFTLHSITFFWSDWSHFFRSTYSEILFCSAIMCPTNVPVVWAANPTSAGTFCRRLCCDLPVCVSDVFTHCHKSLW